jgi:hypothetical protein
MEMETIPFIDRPTSMSKDEQQAAAQKYIDKYREKW